MFFMAMNAQIQLILLFIVAMILSKREGTRMVKARKTMRSKIMMEINQNRKGTRMGKARNAMKKTRRKMRRKMRKRLKKRKNVR